KLLRVLQEHVYEPLGSTEPTKSTARIVAATNQNLTMLVETGEFRRDLFYRIHIMPLTLPPLRERTDDIPLLVDHFIAHFNRLYRKDIDTVSPEAMSILITHRYPGNIRELENILQHAFVLCRSTTIERDHLPEYLFQADAPTAPRPAHDEPSWESYEKRRITKTLQKNKFSRVQTAKELGIHVATLWRRMKKLRIDL
ncbi:MAG: Fis family transcriptional regulator, partial [Chitinivibrionales bacterium]|nr:Fis family transcriptional regulator [Chitinivibrionales bacterium]MBD3358153.1 Fis family transcriptional regulator [Chitinivibrionales bacterium]